MFFLLLHISASTSTRVVKGNLKETYDSKVLYFRISSQVSAEPSPGTG